MVAGGFGVETMTAGSAIIRLISPGHPVAGGTGFCHLLHLPYPLAWVCLLPPIVEFARRPLVVMRIHLLTPVTSNLTILHPVVLVLVVLVMPNSVLSSELVAADFAAPAAKL